MYNKESPSIDYYKYKLKFVVKVTLNLQCCDDKKNSKKILIQNFFCQG